MSKILGRIYNLFVKALIDGNLDVKTDFDNYIHSRSGGSTIDSGLYALKLNFKYCVKRYSQDKADAKLQYPETAGVDKRQLSVEKILNNACDADIVSFDVFDTLLFRPFKNPSDLFYLLEMENGICGFRTMRVEAEKQAYELCRTKGTEPDIAFIYDILKDWCQIDAESGIKQEIELETRLCYANPYMLQVVKKLQEENKRIICVSDMYLGSRVISNILEKCGYPKFDNVYVSCDMGASKHDGTLQNLVKSTVGQGKIYHIGDNWYADVEKSKAAFENVDHYININKIGQEYRATGMHRLVGSIYSGMVSSRFYASPEPLDIYYEYGYACGGLLLYGFAQWLYEKITSQGIDKVLFMARDGRVIYDLFDKCYPEIEKEYVYFSRSASERVVAYGRFEEYIINCVQPVFIKKGVNMTVSDLLSHCGLEFIANQINFGADEQVEAIGYAGIREELYRLKKEILNGLETSKEAGLDYLKSVVGDARNIYVVDSGWRGSSIAYMRDIVAQISECKVSGGLVITSMSEYSEAYRSCGIINSYINVEMNRKLIEICQSQDKRVAFECLFSSTDATLLRYEKDAEGSCSFVFGKKNPEKDMVERIQAGMKDFIEDYTSRLGKYANEVKICPEDAIAPFVKVSQSKQFISRIVGNCNNNALARHGQCE